MATIRKAALGESPVVHGIAIVLWAAILLVPSMTARDLWSQDEIRYAEVTRQMVESGNLIVPHLNGAPYSDKPPLFFWLSSFVWRCGFGAHAGQVISVLATIGTMLLTYRIGADAGSRRFGIVSAVVLGSFELVAWLGRQGVTDPLLMACVALALFGLVRSTSGSLRTGPGCFHIGLGLAVLAKGPVAVLVVLLAVVAMFSVDPARLRPAWPSLLRGIPISIGIIAAWVVPACLVGGADFTRDLVIRQSAGRVVASFAHAKPWYYYLLVTPVVTLPWTLFLGARGSWKSEDRSRLEVDRLVRFAVVWVVLGIVALMLVSGKRERYLLPLLPGFAWIVAGTVIRSIEGRDSFASVWRFRGLHGLGLTIGVALVILPWVPLESFFARDRIDASATVLVPTRVLASALAIVCVAAAIAGFRATHHRQFGRSFAWAVCTLAVLSLSIDAILLPGWDARRSPAVAADRLRRPLESEPETELVLVGSDYSGAFNFHLRLDHIPVVPVEQLDALLDDSGNRWFVLSQTRYAAHCGSLGAHEVRSLGSIGRREIVAIHSIDGAGRSR